MILVGCQHELRREKLATVDALPSRLRRRSSSARMQPPARASTPRLRGDERDAVGRRQIRSSSQGSRAINRRIPAVLLQVAAYRGDFPLRCQRRGALRAPFAEGKSAPRRAAAPVAVRLYVWTGDSLTALVATELDRRAERHSTGPSPATNPVHVGAVLAVGHQHALSIA
jgi:hypothetical protein